MKYPHQVTASHIQVTQAEIEAVAASMAGTMDGMEYTLEFPPPSLPPELDILKDKWVKFMFRKPLKGRDRKGSRVYCTGFGIMLTHDRGPDLAPGPDGRPGCPAPIVEQYSATFVPFGHSIRYRGRNRVEIHDSSLSLHQWDTDLSAIDFSRNLAYFTGIQPEKPGKK